MLRCEICGADFPVDVEIGGRRRNLRGRKRRLECRPYRQLKGPRKRVVRLPKVLVCAACGRRFPSKMMIEGRIRSLYRRRFCLECSPFGGHNTSRVPLPVGTPDESKLARRNRRRSQFQRALRKRRRNRKRELVEAFGGKCVECGYSACLEALQFHHRDAGTKRFSLANFSGRYSEMWAEAKKCDLLCANCHRSRHVPREPETSVVALRRKKKMMAVERFEGICQGCRGRFQATVFEFHHWDAAEKAFEIATRGMNRSWRAIVEELAKCVMLCANCHCEVHAGKLALVRPSSQPTAVAI